MAEEEGITYEMLQDLLRSERRTNKLMPLPARFWPKLQEFLTTINEAFRVEQARDPFSRDVMKLTDQVKNARHASASLWALRERKLAMLALAQQRAGKPPEGITPDEADLYGGLLSTLQAARQRVLPDMGAEQARPGAALGAPVGRAEGPGGQPAGGGAPSAPTSPGTPTAAVPAQPGPAPALQVPVLEAPITVPQDVRSEQPMVMIRALGDIPAFVGPDMQTYLLKAGDIASVPQSIARLLERRKKAAIIEA